jgi:hypothetical protein
MAIGNNSKKKPTPHKDGCMSIRFRLLVPRIKAIDSLSTPYPSAQSYLEQQLLHGTDDDADYGADFGAAS